ncbi:MAG: hypothetical protein AAGC71_16375 [Pseudomonadota bacterium]
MVTAFIRVTSAVTLSLSLTAAYSDDFDYEFRIGYDATDSTAAFGFATIPPVGGIAITDSDGATLRLAGTWFYGGLSDDKGPRTRAEFLDRASSLSLGLSFTETDTSTVEAGPPAPLLPPQILIEGTTSDDEYGFAVRHVWRDSGYIVNVSVSRGEAEGAATSLFGAPATTVEFDADIDETTYTIGFGYYLSQATAVVLSYARIDTDVAFGGEADVDVWSANLTHVAELNADWHYAIDASVGRSDAEFNDSDVLTINASLLPGNDIEFGVGLSREEPEFGGDIDSRRLFGRWFIRNNIELEAAFVQIEQRGFPGFDTDVASVGVNARF